jgi:hypothetical protein
MFSKETSVLSEILFSESFLFGEQLTSQVNELNKAASLENGRLPSEELSLNNGPFPRKETSLRKVCFSGMKQVLERSTFQKRSKTKEHSKS